MVAAVDDDHVFDPAGEVQLPPVQIDTEITCGKPQSVVGDIVGVAVVAQPGLQLVAEHTQGLFGPAEVAAPDIVAVQPDLTDGPVGKLFAVGGLAITAHWLGIG